ncbi:MAG: S49 family peptidase [Bacteroidales bacterium]|nr:S49 family peptidase [Bacteroidales bacterium]
MKKSFVNNRMLAGDILRGKWLLDSRSAPKMLEAARAFLRRELVNGTNTEPIRLTFQALDGQEQTVPSGEDANLTQPFVLIVPLQGTLTQYDNCFGTATMEVVDILEQYRTDENVIGFILDINSPGGAVNAVMPLVNEIKKIQADGKPIIAHCDFAASAAYWIASQTDAIIMDNILSEVGSIGVCATVIDDREDKATGEKRLTIYAPQSVDKNKAYRDALDGKFETMEKELSETAVVFQESVKAGRPKLKAEAEGVLSGAVFTTAKAIELNMADGTGDLASCVEIVAIRASRF